VPQTAQLNRGPWRRLEDRVRELVLEHHEVHVITGTFYDGTPMPPLPEADESHRVPTGFWKVVVVHDGSADNGGAGVAAFAMPQQGFSASSPAAYLVSIDEIETRTGLNLFPGEPDHDWNSVEAEVCDGARWR